MKILITGHTGLLGSNLVKALSGHKILGLSRSKGHDLLDKEKTEKVIKKFKPDVVYHLAANCAESTGEVIPIDMTERNLMIFLHTLIPSINSGVKRFIYTSSVAVYGEAEIPYAEDDIEKPKDVYGVNKLACEKILKILAKVHNFDYTIVRPHNLYGPNQDMSNPYKNVVALFMRSIIEDTEITLFGEGKMKRAFSYIEDVVDVMVKLMDEKFRNHTLNLGSSIDIDIMTLVKMIEKVSGKKMKKKSLPARPQEIYLFLASHRKQNYLVDYHETPLEEGLKKTWDFLNLPEIIKIPKEIK